MDHLRVIGAGFLLVALVLAPGTLYGLGRLAHGLAQWASMGPPTLRWDVIIPTLLVCAVLMGLALGGASRLLRGLSSGYRYRRFAVLALVAAIIAAPAIASWSLRRLFGMPEIAVVFGATAILLSVVPLCHWRPRS